MPATCACGSASFAPFLSLAASPPCDAYQTDRSAALALQEHPLDLFRCCGCGLVQLRPVVRPEVLYSNYIYRTSRSPGLIEHFDRYADDLVMSLGLKPSDFAVDIGCNDGALLRALGKRAVRILGIDPAGIEAESDGRVPVPIHVGFFSRQMAMEIRDIHGEAKVITANNVLANVLDLADFLAGVTLLLADDGVFVFETFYLPDLLTNIVVEMINHEHYYYFTVGALRSLLRNAGLELISAARVGTKGGSIRCAAVKIGHAGLSRLNNPTNPAGLAAGEDNLDPRPFQDQWERSVSMVNRMVSGVSEIGGRVVGFGASAGTTILMYGAGLVGRIEALADDNLLRHGMFAPGSGIEVIAPKAYYRLAPSATVLFAWRYAEAIIEKHQPHLPPDHKFIIPLPAARALPA